MWALKRVPDDQREKWEYDLDKPLPGQRIESSADDDAEMQQLEQYL